MELTAHAQAVWGFQIPNEGPWLKGIEDEVLSFEDLAALFELWVSEQGIEVSSFSVHYPYTLDDYGEPFFGLGERSVYAGKMMLLEHPAPEVIEKVETIRKLANVETPSGWIVCCNMG